MAETLQDPSFLDSEVATQKSKILEQLEEAKLNCNNLTTEVENLSKLFFNN